MKNMRSHVEILSPEEILMIHQAALRVLSRIGFHVPNDECLRRCVKAGAKVDFQTQIVRIPVERMEEVLVMLKPALEADRENTPKLAGGISTQVFVVDYLERTRRYGRLDDIMKGIAMLDHLPNIPSCNATTVPADVDSRISDVATYNLLLKYSAKAGGTYVINPLTAQYILDMGDVMGRKEFYLFETISPLKFRPETLEMGLTFADRGHSLGIAPMIVGGSTGPATMAGTMTLVVAEILASLFSVYAISGQKSGWFGHGSHFSDPRTMLCSFGSPVQAMLAVASAQMARFYGFQAGSNAALSDALLPDFQCGFEKTLSAVMGALAGTVSIGCQGIAGADQGFSFEQLVLDDAWLDAYNFVVSGFEVDAAHLAEDLIADVGIGGNFLAEEHTAEYTRESWWPSKVFARESFDMWRCNGMKSALDRAHELVEEYTAGYKDRQPVVDASKAEDLDRIYEDAKKRIAANQS